MSAAAPLPADRAERMLSTDFLAFDQAMNVAQAIERLRAVQRDAPASYAYVVGAAGRLTGVLHMRDLLLASSTTPLQSIMRRDVVAVRADASRADVARELAARKFFAMPVVDAERRLLGVVRSEQLLAEVQEAATEDLVRMVGAGRDERVFSPVPYAVRARLPWLHVNLATAFLAAAVVGAFESLIARLTILAVFLPIVAGQGGNAGAQSLAVVTRGLALREVRASDGRRLIAKEALLGAVNGLAIGVVTALAAWLWHGNAFLGLVIGLAMLVNLVVAGTCGAAIPLGLKALGRDPAQGSSVILTTFTDVIGFLAFLGFALLFEPHLR